MTITVKPGVLASHAQRRGLSSVTDLAPHTGIAPARLTSIQDGGNASMVEASRIVLALGTSIRETFYCEGISA